MVSVKHQMYIYLLLPFIFSLAGALMRSWVLFVLAAAVLFVLTRAFLVCAGRESLWVFLSGFFSVIPFNIYLIRRLTASWWAVGIAETWFDGALWIVLIYLTLLSVEEIILLLLSRIIWPNQDDDETLQELIEDSRHKGGKKR